MRYFYCLFILIGMNIFQVQADVDVSNSISVLRVGYGTPCPDVALGTITIKETENSDFANGTGSTYSIDLPAGFVFTNIDATSIDVVYTGGTTYTPGSKTLNASKTRFLFAFTIATTVNDIGTITISGMRVKCTNPGSFGDIMRAGDAVQAGNAPGNKSHGFLDSRIEIDYFDYDSETLIVPSPGLVINGSCASEYLYFSAGWLSQATYRLYEGTVKRDSVTSGSTPPFSGKRGLPGIIPNSNGGPTSFHVEATTANGCFYRSENMNFEFLPTPYALKDFSADVFESTKYKDTIFPKSAPVVEINPYIQLPAGTTLVSFSGPGVYNTGASNYVFDPSSVITGQHQISYYLSNGTCTKRHNMKHKFTVYDPLEPPPPYIYAQTLTGAAKNYPYCENGGDFNVYFRPPEGTRISYLMIYLEQGESVSINTLYPTDAVAGPFRIDPVNDTYNGRIYTYMGYREASGLYQYVGGYITIFPARKPQLLGLPPHFDDTLLLCKVGKDSIIMHATPTGGQYIIEKSVGGVFSPLSGAQLSEFAKPPVGAPNGTYRAFIPEDLFNGLGESNLDIQFRVTYIYPPIGLSVCPDTVIKYLRFVDPVDVNYTILSPSSTPYCDGDPITFRINNANPTDRFYWNFGDGISKERDSLLVSTYTYSSPGKYILRFKSMVDDLPVGACNNDLRDTIRIGAKPNADFLVENNYEDEESRFSSLTILRKENPMEDNGLKDKINSWSWLYGDGKSELERPDSVSVNIYDHYKAKPYLVTHIVRSGWGCTDTARKAVPVFPLVDLTAGNYEEKFDTADSTGFYQSGDYNMGGNASWQYRIPADNNVILGTSPAWITENEKVDTSYNFDEFSWVESPAFRLDQLIRPMLAMDTWCLTENQLDGACLQWAFADTSFGKEKWRTIGIRDEGVNWYNSNLVVGMLNKVVKNGIHTPGWTGSTGEKWQRSAFNLDVVKQQAGNRLVRFRILFVSNSDNAPGQYDGFAFDNFFVGERNRKVLVEEFCDYEHYEQKFMTAPYLLNDQMVRVQYHSRYLRLDDEINNQNKGEAGARNLLYGYSELPRASVDGGYSLDYANGFFSVDLKKGLGERNFEKRLLEPSPFSIAIHPPVIADNALQFSVDMKRDKVVESQGPYTLQVVVAEKEVVGNGIRFTNVFRKFLPDAGGFHVDKDKWGPGEVKTLHRSFTPFTKLTERNDSDTSLLLIAFIQDENTSEVYQAQVVPVLYQEVKMLQTVPLPHRINPGTENISLYPNPAQGWITIEHEDGESMQDYQYRVMDSFGKVVKSGSVDQPGAVYTLTGLENIPVGIYQLQLQKADRILNRSFSVVR